MHGGLHLALVRGEPARRAAAGARARADTLARPARHPRRALGWTLRARARAHRARAHGVVVVLRPEELPSEIVGTVRARARAGRGASGGSVLRTYGIGAQILRDLGVHAHARAVGAAPHAGMSAFGLEIAGYEE